MSYYKAGDFWGTLVTDLGTPLAAAAGIESPLLGAGLGAFTKSAVASGEEKRAKLQAEGWVPHLGGLWFTKPPADAPTSSGADYLEQLKTTGGEQWATTSRGTTSHRHSSRRTRSGRRSRRATQRRRRTRRRGGASRA